MSILIKCGGYHTMLLTSNGIYGTGRNDNGQLGLNNTTDRNVFTKITSNVPTGTFISIAGGILHTMLLTSNGIYGTGNNDYGQLGLGDYNTRNVFTKITSNVPTGTFISLVCGSYHTMLLTSDGIYTTGDNGAGQLGLGDYNTRNVFTKITSNVPTGTFISIAGGDSHTMLLTSNGIYGTGNNGDGQLGLGDYNTRNVFTKITSNVPTGTFISIECGRAHTMLLTSDGIYGTGRNDEYELGLGNNTNRNVFTKITSNVPTGTFISISCGQFNTMLLTSDGIYATGYNAYGQLGLGDIGSRIYFIKITVASGSSVPTGTFISLVCGSHHTMLLTSDGIYGTGLNSQGSLGLGNNTNRYTFTKTSFVDSATGSAPTSVTATATGSSTISISFAGSTGGTPSPTTYYYSFNNGTTKTDASTTSSPFTISGLSAGTSYTVVLYAYNANWPSPFSSASSSSTATTYGTGSAPTSVTATATSSTAISISFIGSTGGTPSPSTYYYSFDNGTTKTNASTTSSPFTISNLSPGTSYTVVLYAYNSNWPSPFSSASSSSTVTTLYVSGSAPTSVTATATSYDAISVSFTGSTGGTPAPSTYYYILNSGSKINSNTTSSPFTISGLSAGTSYTVVLYAYNVNWPSIDHFSSASSTANVTTYSYSNGTAPTITNISSTFTQLLVTFSSSTNGVPPVSGYYYKLNSGGYIGPVTSPFSISGLSVGTSYSIVVYAYNTNWPTQYIASSEYTQSTLSTNYYYGQNNIATFFQYLYNINGNGFNQTNYLTSGSNIFNKLILYAFGTRSGIGFKINNVDIGNYFQRDSITYASVLGNYTISPWGTQGSIFQYARWIWNDPNAATSAAANIYLWFYYTFYYSGGNNTGTVYAMCDNVGEFWLNGVDIGAIGGGWGSGSYGNTFNINIVNGLNYIRVAAYNTATGSAGLLIAVYDSASNHIVSTSVDWVVTTSASYNTGASAFNSLTPV